MLLEAIMRKTLFAFVLVLASAGITAIFQSPAAPATEATFSTTDVGGVTVSTATSADGTTETSITGPSSAAAAPTITQDANSASAELSLPPVTDSTGKATMSAMQSAQAPTVYQDLMASGMTADEACTFVTDFDSRGCVATKPFLVTKASLSSTLYDSWCVNQRVTKGDGTKTSHACVIRYKDWSSGGNWYVANKMKMSANSVNPGAFFDRFNDIRVQMRYGAYNTTVDWAPIADRSTGYCKNMTTSVSSPKTGAGYSSSAEVCPDKIAPYASPAFRWFGSRWTTSSARAGYVGTVAASVVHSPANASVSSAKLYSYMHWT